jgi:DNA-directed RNA polymerase specialized sigma subunit
MFMVRSLDEWISLPKLQRGGRGNIHEPAEAVQSTMTTPAVAVYDPCLPSFHDSDETDWVDRLKSGDEDAYESLFRQHSGAMMAAARRFFGDTDEAADAVQDAFVSAFKAMGTFEGTARLTTWLHRITVNACLMKLRAQRRSRIVPLDEMNSQWPETKDQACEELARMETAIRVRHSISTTWAIP